MMDKSPAEKEKVKRLMELWFDTESKARILVFYRENPGLIESVEGLARRLGLPPEKLGAEIEDYKELGLLRSLDLEDRAVYVFDRRRAHELEELMRANIDTATGGL